MQAQYDAETEARRGAEGAGRQVLQDLDGERARSPRASSRRWSMRAARPSSSCTAPTASWRWATSRRSPAATRSTGRCSKRSSRRTPTSTASSSTSRGLMAVVTPPDCDAGAAAGTSRPAAVARLFASMAGSARSPRSGGRACRSACSPASGSSCWAIGWADPKLLPPPHIFLGNIAEQGKFFNTATRWQIGKSMTDGPIGLRIGDDHRRRHDHARVRRAW